MTKIVTHANRPKRPPRKRAKAAPVIGSAIVRPGKGKAGNDNPTPAETAPNRSAIVSGKTRGPRRPMRPKRHWGADR